VERSREDAPARHRGPERLHGRARFKGFSSGTLTEKWGILAGNTGFLTFDNVEIPGRNLVGREGEGFKIAMFALDQGRYTVAAGATGLIRACRDASVKYALDRHTFGVEIGQHQLVKEMIARMEADYQSTRLLWLRSGWLKNEGAATRARRASPSGWRRSRRSGAAGDAVQIHGANGYSDEYPVGRFYRNCKGAVIYEGTARDPHDHAGRLPARLSHRSADALRAAALQGARVTEARPRRVGVAPGGEGAATIWAPAAIAEGAILAFPTRRSTASASIPRARTRWRRSSPPRAAPRARRSRSSPPTRAPSVASRPSGARPPSGWRPRSGQARSRWWCPCAPARSAPEVTAGRDTVAVRVPGHPLARVLAGCAPAGVLTATSANRSGSPALTTADDVERALGEERGADRRRRTVAGRPGVDDRRRDERRSAAHPRRARWASTAC
jgi:hypothetical protein